MLAVRSGIELGQIDLRVTSSYIPPEMTRAMLHYKHGSLARGPQGRIVEHTTPFLYRTGMPCVKRPPPLERRATMRFLTKAEIDYWLDVYRRESTPQEMLQVARDLDAGLKATVRLVALKIAS